MAADRVFLEDHCKVGRVLGDWECEVCGEPYSPVPGSLVEALYLETPDDGIGSQVAAFICPDCLALTPKEMAGELQGAADWHNEQAENFRRAAAVAATMEDWPEPLPDNVVAFPRRNARTK